MNAAGEVSPFHSLEHDQVDLTVDKVAEIEMSTSTVLPL